MRFQLLLILPLAIVLDLSVYAQNEQGKQEGVNRVFQSDDTADRPTIVEHTFYIFDYDNQESKRSLESMFVDKQGIISVSSDLEAETLTVITDSRLSQENIASFIAAAGLKKSKSREEHLAYKRRNR